ncbi:conserved Plasmodium protein, unknown function [Plasmodium chabaudi chabaudi]|uniref:Uncharacterized protein n=1 Tax=Plasmodium chabaudi chabaudi TaxID=31271 RepID=A0A4V0K4K4_PLACU|nr:conserved Plasmodium protein, unknown function [Plasmodium chabaudi chabaudi]VTZ67531.1 conserved Plasmodium protein, unknown function [Plasmodium chabaudi chabaudi]|eukprot:XP_742794.2 conserved Plasmodium protein, unknown function [Plasmodium chabaudi chabaudi]
MGKKINIAIYLILLNLFGCGIKYGESGIPVIKSFNLRNSYENKKNSQTDINTVDNTNIQDDQNKLVIEGNDESSPEIKENTNEDEKGKKPSDPVEVSDQENTHGTADKKEEDRPKDGEKISSEQGAKESPSNPGSQAQTQVVNNSGGDSHTATDKPEEKKEDASIPKETQGTEPTDNNGKTVEGGATQKTGQENSDKSLGDVNHGDQKLSPAPTEGHGVTPQGNTNGESANNPSSLGDQPVDVKQPNNEEDITNKDNTPSGPKKGEDTSVTENSDSIGKEKTQQKETVIGKNSDKDPASDDSPENTVDNTKDKTKEVHNGADEDSNNLAGNTKTEESNSIVEVPPVAPSKVPEQKQADANTLELPPANPNNVNTTNLKDTESNVKTGNDGAPKEDGTNEAHNNQTIIEEAGNDPKSETDPKDNAVNKNVELKYDNEEEEEEDDDEDENVVDESVNVIESDAEKQDDNKEETESEEDDENNDVAEEALNEANETNENEKEKVPKESENETTEKEEDKEEPTTIDSKAKKIISEYYQNMKNIKNKIKDYVKSAMDLIDGNNGISKAFSNLSEDISNFILKL